MRVLLGISGASGAVYGVRVASLLLARGADLHVLATKTAWEILAAEVGDGKLPASFAARKRWLARLFSGSRPFALHAEDDFRIPFASGSNAPDAMIVAPCSMGTLGRIAHGVSDSVLTRCKGLHLVRHVKSMLPGSHNRPEFQRHRYPVLPMGEVAARLSRFQQLLGDHTRLAVEPITATIYRIRVA